MAWLIPFIKSKEGFRENAYEDLVGTWTIGYGSTHKVSEGDYMSEEDASALLEAELQTFLDYVIFYGDSKEYEWNDNQIAALTSFCYNLGKGSLRQLTDNGKRDNETIATKMLLYKNAGGKPIRGLEIRRQEECDHFKKRIV